MPSIKFRETTPEDAPTIAEWIEADPYHRGRVEPSFFLDGNGKASTYCVEDGAGPVMFVRQDVEGTTTRLHIEFAPGARKRIRESFAGGFGAAVIADAKQRGFEAIAFTSASPSLIGYLAQQFGVEAECTLKI